MKSKSLASKKPSNLTQETMDRVKYLLEIKDQYDNALRERMIHHKVFMETIRRTNFKGHAKERIVAVIGKNTKGEAELIKLSDAVKTINSELLTIAPNLFDKTTKVFQSPVVIDKVIRLTVSHDSAILSKKYNGNYFLRHISDFIAQKEREIENNYGDHWICYSAMKAVDIAKKEYQFFEKHSNILFRKRGNPVTDTIATYSQSHSKDKHKRLHVTAGGLIVIKHPTCLKSSIKVTRPERTASIYENITPMTSIAYPSCQIYFEDEVEHIRTLRFGRTQDKGYLSRLRLF